MLKSKLKPQNKWWYLVYLAIGLVIIYFGLVRPVQVRLEKARYEKAASELETLYTKITSKVGEPTQVKRDKSCAYASRAYGHGPLSCNVAVYMLYENSNAAKANSILENTYNYLGDAPSNFSLNKYGTRVDEKIFLEPQIYRSIHNNAGIIDQSLSADITTVSIGGLVCTYSYTFPVIDNYGSLFKLKYDTNLLIGYSCSGYPLAHYYPVD